MNLILFGFKGSGKTHFGKKLAKITKRPFIDTDDLAEALYAAKSGKHLSVREISKKIGEIDFRTLENQAIYSLKTVQDSIIALGGGAILEKSNLELLLKIGSLVYLEADVETLKQRIFTGGVPSFFDEKDPLKSFYEMIHLRRPIYESISAHRINTQNLDESDVLKSLQSILVTRECSDGF